MLCKTMIHWLMAPLLHDLESRAKKSHQTICLSILKEFCFSILGALVSLFWCPYNLVSGDICTPHPPSNASVDGFDYKLFERKLLFLTF